MALQKQHKVLIVVSSLIVLSVSAAIIYHFSKRMSEKKIEEEERIKEEAKQTQAAIAANDGYIRPKFNRNGELINPGSELIGAVLIAKKDGVNLRSSAKVDNMSTADIYLGMLTGSGFAFATNIRKKVNKGNYVGKVKAYKQGAENPPMTWFQLQDGLWVRADVVTFLPFKK